VPCRWLVDHAVGRSEVAAQQYESALRDRIERGAVFDGGKAACGIPAIR